MHVPIPVVALERHGVQKHEGLLQSLLLAGEAERQQHDDRAYRHRDEAQRPAEPARHVVPTIAPRFAALQRRRRGHQARVEVHQHRQQQGRSNKPLVCQRQPRSCAAPWQHAEQKQRPRHRAPHEGRPAAGDAVDFPQILRAVAALASLLRELMGIGLQHLVARHPLLLPAEGPRGHRAAHITRNAAAGRGAVLLALRALRVRAREHLAGQDARQDVAVDGAQARRLALRRRDPWRGLGLREDAHAEAATLGQPRPTVECRAALLQEGLGHGRF
mmetsp:Transcript_87086/g.243735  ORF Transcript_87086/g.243735 Transcript_87086/m.243735 type:complete len:274 (+) Transcript_87086:401-1222(+)